MDKLLFVTLMCVFPALIATIIHGVKKEEKWKLRIDFKVMFFYFSCFLTVICLFKTVVGYANGLLLESYSDVGVETFLHYIPILLVMSVIAPLVVKLFPIKVIYLFDSLFFFLWSIEYFIIGGTKNLVTVVLFFLSFITSIVWILFCKKEVAFCNFNQRKKDMGYISSVVLFGIITTYVYIPQEIYLANAEEMVIAYNTYALYVFLGSAVLALVYIMGVVFLLTKRQLNLYMVLFFAANFAGYLQANFLNGEMSALDGNIQKWDGKTILINVAIWILIFLFVLFIRFFSPIKDKSKKIIQVAAIYISLMQVVSLTVLIITTEKNTDLEYSFSKEYMLELDEENNVIVFVLDWLDQQILEDVVADDATILEEFKDFTWYTNATSQYAYTFMSLPYLMTGIEWQPGMSEYEYYKEALEESDFLKSINEKGYDVGIYTDHYFANETLSKVTVNISSDDKNIIPFVGLFDLAEKSARYRMVPFGIKENYVYFNWDYSNMRYEGQYSVDYDDQFYADLQEKGITVSDKSKVSEGSLRLYHLHGSHRPYRLNANAEVVDYEKAEYKEISYDERLLEQTKGNLKIVSDYLEQMKQKGLFENATIIITADHGQNLYLNEEERANDKEDLTSGGYEFTSTPIMFVKTPGQVANDEIRISVAPVSHQEVLAQVLRSVGVESDMRIFSEIGEDEVRERTFIRGRCDDIPFKKYVINGHARDEKSWKEVPLQ